MADPACRSCGSDKIIPDADVFDHDSVSWRPLGITVALGTPKPAEFLGIAGTQATQTSPMKARVCGQCGTVELYAPDAAALWAAHTA